MNLELPFDVDDAADTDASASMPLIAPERTPRRPPTEREKRITGFVSSLLHLASTDDGGQKNRAAMAALRGSLRGTPTDFYRSARYVVNYLGEYESEDDRWFYLIGGLFALHPLHKNSVSLGKACRVLRDDGGSMDTRFLALLGTRADGLPRVLRQMISLLGARGVGFDYVRLLSHLCAWDSPENWVQKRWASDYFRDATKAKADNANANSADDETNEASNDATLQGTTDEN